MSDAGTVQIATAACVVNTPEAEYADDEPEHALCTWNS
jgi:hypothetical protein